MKIILYLALICSLFIPLNACYSKQIILKPISKSILQETDDVTWSSISNVSFSPNSKLMAISSYQNMNYIGLYNAKDFSFSKSISVDRDLTNSIIPKVGILKNGYKVMPVENYSEGNWGMIANSFRFARFKSDSVLSINADISYIAVPDSDSFENALRLRFMSEAVIIDENINSGNEELYIMQQHLLADSIPTFAQIYNFIHDDKNSLIYTITTDKSRRTSVGKYDLMGKFIEQAHTFPQEMIDSKIMTRITYNPVMALNNDNDLILAYPFLSKIYNATKNTNFELKNLAKDNSDVIQKLVEGKIELSKARDSIFIWLDLKINNIWIDKNNNIIVHYTIRKRNDADTTCTYLQVYSQAGDLLGETKLDYKNEIGRLEYIHYNIYNDSFYLFRKQEDWTIEKYSWSLK